MDDQGGQKEARGALLELIEVEQRIEADLAAAEAQASQILSSAQAEARALEDDGGALESALAALRASVARECDDVMRRLEAESQGEVRRLHRVDEAKLRELAHWLAAQVFADRADR